MSEEMIIHHCSPTLAGLKTASLFSCTYNSSYELKQIIRRFNRMLSSKGLRFLPLRIAENHALIYVYRPSKLKADLANSDADEILKGRGYYEESPERCIVKLINRLKENEEFPHEIGLFLGYPPEDVRGFIENGAKCSKCVGCWKVYGDVEQAQKTFARYKKCTDAYKKQLQKGKSIEKLTIAV